MDSAEKIVGVIPHAVSTVGIRKFFVVVITNGRLIVVVEAKTRMASALLLGIGGLATGAFMKHMEPTNYPAESPDALASREGSLSIPFGAIERIRLFFEWGGGHHLRVEYQDTNGKRRKTDVYLVPSDELLAARKAGGEKSSATQKAYGQAAQDLLRASLPAELVARSEWKA